MTTTYIRPIARLPDRLTPFFVAFLLLDWPFVEIAGLFILSAIAEQTLHGSMLYGRILALTPRLRAARPFAGRPTCTLLTTTLLEGIWLRETGIFAQNAVHVLGDIVQPH